MKKILPLLLAYGLALALVVFALSSCSSPFVGRAQFDGQGTMAFDGDLFAVAADGAGQADLSVKGSAAPMYLYAWADSVIYVASIEGDWNETYALGEPISDRARLALASAFSPEQMALLESLQSGTHPEE